MKKLLWIILLVFMMGCAYGKIWEKDGVKKGIIVAPGGGTFKDGKGAEITIKTIPDIGIVKE